MSNNMEFLIPGRGIFITFEGGEGAGKSYQASKIKTLLENDGIDVVLTREPGGVALAESIREILIGPQATDMDSITETLLYAAARREHYKKIIEPALQNKKVVICDRFIDSSIVYQGMVRKAGIDMVNYINKHAIDHRLPDITFYLDVDPELSQKRLAKDEQRVLNRFDNADLSFHTNIRESFIELSNSYERIKLIDASQSKRDVTYLILKELKSMVDKLITS